MSTQRSPLRPTCKDISQPQTLNTKSYFHPHHPRSLPMKSVFQCSYYHPRIYPYPLKDTGTSEKIQLRGPRTQSTSPLSSLHEYRLSTCPIFNSTSHFTPLYLAFRHSFGHHSFSSSPLLPKRLDLLKACTRSIVALARPLSVAFSTRYLQF
ncbi:hypothetical protein EI94DRAFT_1713689 [Lactarius quietus]|nr:hypothetical protein EI94DRAFT_1713689 [Lactarius quietus]